MNHLRIRVVKLKPDGTDFLFAVQSSEYGLVWWTLKRFKSFDEALEHGKGLLEFVGKNFAIKQESVLWTKSL